MTKYRIVRQMPGAGASNNLEERVISAAEGYPAPRGAEVVAGDTPLTEWTPVSLAPTPDPNDTARVASEEN